MALRLRRGTNAERLLVTPLEGELVYTTDTKKIFAGDGTTIGGTEIAGLNSVVADTTPQLGGNLDLNSKNIKIKWFTFLKTESFFELFYGRISFFLQFWSL